jgi:uncharacterized membrane protein YhaH (DUF805 family)
MSFADAVRSGFTKYAKFDGRASRREFWYWLGFVVLTTALLYIIEGSMPTTGGFGGLARLVFLFMLCPTVAAGARRLHDIGKSGWWQLVPIYSWVLAAQPGEEGDNRYGVPPGRPEPGWGARQR